MGRAPTVMAAGSGTAEPLDVTCGASAVAGRAVDGLDAAPQALFSGRNARLQREWKTVCAMLEIYCRDHHAGGKSCGSHGCNHGDGGRGRLCAECQDLRRYVSQRLERCRFGAEKPTCARCPVHCYRADRRERIRTVMRYAGPRMTYEHPWLSLFHLLDGWFRKGVLQDLGRS